LLAVLADAAGEGHLYSSGRGNAVSDSFGGGRGRAPGEKEREDWKFRDSMKKEEGVAKGFMEAEERRRPCLDKSAGGRKVREERDG